MNAYPASRPAASAAMTPSTSGTPAPYGRACCNCSRAKCRCIYRSDGSGCERCYRLKKECQPSVPVRRRAAVPKKPTAGHVSRTAKLEQKLDGLMSLLSARTEALSSTPGSISLHETADDATGTASVSVSAGSTPHADRPSEFSLSPDALGGVYPRTPESGTSSATAPPKIFGVPVPAGGPMRAEPLSSTTSGLLNLDAAIEPSTAEAQATLQLFRTQMVPFFPFVHIPADLTAGALRQSSPMLWLAIMAVGCQRVPTAVQLARSTRLRQLLAQKIVYEVDKSLDLLQAVLAYMAWIHYSSKRDRPTLSLMAQLAVSLVYDLGLHKPVQPGKSLMARFARDHASTPVSAAADDPPPPPAQPAERRAALATYLMTSVIAIALKRIDPLRWTTRMEEHLDALATHPEAPLDNVLVAQVRFHRIADQVHQGDWQLWDAPPPDGAHDPRTAQESRLVPAYVVRVLRAKLDEVKASIPSEFWQSDGVLGAMLAAETMLCASAVLPISMPVSMLTAYVAPVTHVTRAEVGRVAGLERCVEAIAAFWSFFREIPSDSYTAIPFAIYSYFNHCVMLLYSLSMIREPAWDRAAVRDRLHVVDMLDGFIAKLRAAPQMAPTVTTSSDSFDIFRLAVFMVGNVRDRWAAEMRQTDVDPSRPGTRCAAAAAAPPPPPTLTQVPLHVREDPLAASRVAVAGPWELAPVSAPAAPLVPEPPLELPLQDGMGQQDGLDLFFPDLMEVMTASEDHAFWNVFMSMDGMGTR